MATPLLPSGSRGALHVWLASVLPPLLSADCVANADELQAHVQRTVCGWTTAQGAASTLAGGLAEELRDFMSSDEEAVDGDGGALAGSNAVDTFKTALAQFLADPPLSSSDDNEEVDVEQPATQPLEGSQRTASTAPADEPMAAAPAMHHRTLSSSSPNGTTAATPSRSSSSARKRRDRDSDDDLERGEAEGALLGSESKKRREDLLLGQKPQRPCFEFQRSGRCSRGHSCHFAHGAASAVTAAATAAASSTAIPRFGMPMLSNNGPMFGGSWNAVAAAGMQMQPSMPAMFMQPMGMMQMAPSLPMQLNDMTAMNGMNGMNLAMMQQQQQMQQQMQQQQSMFTGQPNSFNGAMMNHNSMLLSNFPQQQQQVKQPQQPHQPQVVQSQHLPQSAHQQQPSQPLLAKPPPAPTQQPLLPMRSASTEQHSSASAAASAPVASRPASLQRTASNSSTGSLSAAALAASSTSCKLCASAIPEAHLSLPALTSWFASFGSVTTMKLLPPDRCIVTFADHEGAQRAFDAKRSVMDQPAIRLQWIVAKGTNTATAAAAAATAAATPAPSAALFSDPHDGVVASRVVAQFTSHSGKAITLKKKVHPPAAVEVEASGHDAAVAMQHQPQQQQAAPLLLQQMRSNSMPSSSIRATTTAAAHAPLLPSSSAGGTAAVRSYSGGGGGSVAGSSVSSYSTASDSSLRALLASTEGILSKLANLSSSAESDQMQRTLHTKIAAIRSELQRREQLHNGGPAGQHGSAAAIAATVSSPAAAFASAGSSSPTPLNLAAMAPLSSPPRSSSAGAGGGTSSSPLPSPTSLAALALRAQKETALRLASLQSRAALNKARLDDEMDAIRKNAQLATIHEAETIAEETPRATATPGAATTQA